MGELRMIVHSSVLLCAINIVVWGAQIPTVSKLTLTDKTDEVGYHATCHASKPGYKEGLKWQHDSEVCSNQRSLAAFTPLKEDKYSKISHSENEEEFLSTLTHVGTLGKDDGPKHCLCCIAQTDSICFNLTMQHEHDHHHHHNHHHH